MTIMIFDLETTGFIESKPYIVSIAYDLYDEKDMTLVDEYYSVVKPPTDTYEIPQESVNVHGITTEYARANGISILVILKQLHEVFDTHSITKIIAHNIKFDIGVLSIQLNRFDCGDQYGKKLKEKMFNIEGYCTMMNSIEMVNIQVTTKTGRKYKKFPKLIELYKHLFDGEFNAHNARDDVKACSRCYIKMMENA
jgi:DNA polymerase III epsilon subunit-like protein